MTVIRLNRATVPVIPMDGRTRPTLVNAAQAPVAAPAAITSIRAKKEKPKSKAGRWADAVAAARIAVADMETVRDELQEWYDNMPEGLQGSSKGKAVQEVATGCEEAIDALNEALDTGEAVEFSY